MMRSSFCLAAAMFLLLTHWVLSVAQTPESVLAESAGIQFFEKRIRPVLIEKCFQCHSSDSDTLRGNLRLDSRAAVRTGGDSGPAVIPGDADSSILLHAIRYEDYEMPPDGQLPAYVIADFRKWIEMGAPDPRRGDAPTPIASDDQRDGANFWSFQPLRQPDLPAVSDAEWPTSTVDRFILAQLESNGLGPTSDASPASLVRRLFIDLTGLPPTPQQVVEWSKRLRRIHREARVASTSFSEDDRTSSTDSQFDEQYLAQLVDYLLNSPLFGQRWGRHWLDLARYAESTGGGASNVLPDAWKYRDYVIRSMNQDKPYDQFVREQVAGDLLPWASVEQRAEHLVATGFLVMGPRNYITDDTMTFHMDGIDEQSDTMGRVFLGMTVGCARCHDHKFDPIPATDYYALAGILESTLSAKQISGSKNFTWNTVADPREDRDGLQLAAFEERTAASRAISKQVSTLQRAIAAARDSGLVSGAEEPRATDAWIADKERELATLRTRAAGLKEQIPVKPATFMGVQCAQAPAPAHLRVRGNPHRRGEVVPRGFLTAVSQAMPDFSPRPTIPNDQSGRFELAEWLASPQNPLTGRVFVNRVWHHLFGRGIVATVDNFGTTGELPTHPDLLDWLAQRFMEDNYSIKSLVRRIVTSRTYRLSTLGTGRGDQMLLSTDPTNRLFGRRTRRSLDAETIRDAILAVSGDLDVRHGGRTFSNNVAKEYSHVYRSNRRSVYVPRFRNHQLELFQVFDVANPGLVVGRRDQTILPTQALFLMNHPFVVQHAQKSAQRLLSQTGLSTSQKIEQMYLRTLGRWPSSEESTLSHGFLNETTLDAREDSIEAWTALQQALLECVDFRYQD